MNKQYAVDVQEKYSHGRYGKQKYTSWCLSETSKQRACYFAAEIVAGMTWRELFDENHRTIREDIKIMWIPWGCQLDDLIGHENAEKYFTYKAYIQ